MDGVKSMLNLEGYGFNSRYGTQFVDKSLGHGAL